MVSRFVFAGAERAPDKTAIVFNGRALTYGEFARAIEAMVQAFEGHGIAGPGYAVVALTGLLDFWIISLALRELGLATVPVSSPQNAATLRLGDVRLVVTDPEPAWPGLEALCAGRGWPRVRVRWDGALARPVEVGRPRVAAPGEHVLQTSATTGAYKAVLMARSFELAFMRERAAWAGTDEATRFALFNFGGWTGAGYKTAASVWLGGGAIVLGQGADGRLCFAEPDLTHAIMLPDQLAHILAGAAAGAIAYRPDLRLMVGGATPHQSQVDQARALIAPNMYNSIGATETPTFAETRLETPEDRRWHVLLAERDPQIVDDADRPLPIGQVGHIRVSTRNGPTCYLDDPAASAAFFKDGYFYPGDLGLIRADGRMALMGRTTDVINVMGQKISPAPFEDALCERLGISGACLFSRQNDRADESLHLVIESPAPLDIAHLTAVLRQTLSGFPSAEIHYRAALPRNGMGKLMRAEIQRRVGRVQTG
ncbi:MAG TPA: class I adenylate-forming enzyme family protein [Caulobacteraceae bacterium]|nr:class I adenylate-forming enzyme family protein [Caulobacteraceae bacterium]